MFTKMNVYIWHSSVYMRAHPINLHANKQCSLRCLAFNFSLSLKSFWLHNSMLVFISFPPSAVTTTAVTCIYAYYLVYTNAYTHTHTYLFCWRRFSLIHDFQSIKRKVLCCCCVFTLSRCYSEMLHLFEIFDAMPEYILYFHSCYIDWLTWLSKVTTIFMSLWICSAYKVQIEHRFFTQANFFSVEFFFFLKFGQKIQLKTSSYIFMLELTE